MAILDLAMRRDFGYKVFVLGDPKDEYEPLCRAFGVQPFAVGPGMSARINPLDFGPLGDGWDTSTRSKHNDGPASSSAAGSP